MTTPVGFIPSPLDHATPLQGQQMQPARAAGSAAANQPPLNGPSGYPQVPSWAQAGPGASARQANSPAAPADAPVNTNGAVGTSQAIYRAPQLHTNGRGEPLVHFTCMAGPVGQPVQVCSYLIPCQFGSEVMKFAECCMLWMDAMERMRSDKPDMVAENGIAPTTPGRGKLAAPFKLVAPNADMKDIPATFVVIITPCLH